MLAIDVRQIPPEGIDLNEPLLASDLQIEGEAEFRLSPGGHIACHLERSDDGGVHVRGDLSAEISLQCSRCLEEFPLPVPGGLDLFFLPETPGARNEAEEEVELSDRDMVVAYYPGEELNLGEVIREQIIFSVPMKPLCADGCLGRCPSCGVNRNATSCSCPPAEDADPRLASLKKLLDPDSL